MWGHAGKIAGATAGLAAGLMIGGPWVVILPVFAAVAGALLVDRRFDPDEELLRMQLERERPRPAAQAEPDRAARLRFASSLARVVLRLLEADGAIPEEKIRAADRFLTERLGFGEAELRAVDQVFAAERGAAGATLQQACESCRGALHDAERLLLLEGLFDIAASDGAITTAEWAALREAARLLELGGDDVDRFRSVYDGEAAAAYGALGVAKDASADQIKSAFRQLALRHHPDKVAHLGPKAMELASERFRAIQQAYEALRRERGF